MSRYGLNAGLSLIGFGIKWQMSGDLMLCRDCGRARMIQHDETPLLHRDGCAHATAQHPWKELREILSGPDEAGGSR